MHKHRSFLYLTCLLGLSACFHPRAIVLSPTAPQGLRVYGVGEASAAPDIARTQLGVDVRAAGVEPAIAQASQRMAAVVAALQQLGIAPADLHTSQYSVAFEPEPPPPAPAATTSQQPTAADGAAAPRGHYRVTNTLAVTIRDLKLAGRVLQVAADAGANSLWGVSFDVEDDSALLAHARAQAVADARHSAQQLAELAGVELGDVISVTEHEPQGGYFEPNTYAMERSAAVPVEPGEIAVHYGVQLVYTTRSK